MAREFFTPVNLKGNRLLNAVLTLENVAAVSAPFPVAGRIILDGTTVKFHDGSTWIALATGSGGSGGGVPETRTVTAGAGLAGGGDLSANRTFDVGAGFGISVAIDSVAVNTTTVQAKFERGAPNGYVPLDAASLIPSMYLPSLAINETFVVASQAAMLGLTAQTGDMAIRTDTGKTYVLAAEPANVLANWKEIMAAGAVQSVNGQTGVVSITAGSISAASTATQVIAGAGLTGGGALIGNVTLNAVGDATLNVSPDQISVVSAPKWTTPRSITLTGDATGSVTLDGSANVSLATTVTSGGLTLAAADAVFLKPSEILAGSNITVTPTGGGTSVTIASTATGGGTEVDEVFVGPTAPPTPFDGQVWINLEGAGNPNPGTGGGGGSSSPTGTWPYKWKTSTAATDPTHGWIKANDTMADFYSEIYISVYDDNNQAFLAVNDLTTGSEFHLYEAGQISTWNKYRLTAPPVLQGSPVEWATLPVVYVESGPLPLTPTGNANMVLTILGGAAAGGLTQAQADALFLKPSEILAGTNITVTPTGNSVTIASTGGAASTSDTSGRWTFSTSSNTTNAPYAGAIWVANPSGLYGGQRLMVTAVDAAGTNHDIAFDFLRPGDTFFLQKGVSWSANGDGMSYTIRHRSTIFDATLGVTIYVFGVVRYNDNFVPQTHTNGQPVRFYWFHNRKYSPGEYLLDENDNGGTSPDRGMIRFNGNPYYGSLASLTMMYVSDWDLSGQYSTYMLYGLAAGTAMRLSLQQGGEILLTCSGTVVYNNDATVGQYTYRIPVTVTARTGYLGKLARLEVIRAVAGAGGGGGPSALLMMGG